MGRVIVTEDDFDIGKEMDSLKQSGVGAIASFVGIVRDYAEGPSLIAMTLEHYEGMTEQEISNIIDIACDDGRLQMLPLFTDWQITAA